MASFIPGLGGLRGFEAAARHSSFTKAAAELGVTPAAVSHLVRELEDQLGVKLFTRSSRVVRLTSAGEILQQAAAEAIETVGRAMARLRDVAGRPRLMVTSSPSFAAKWLVPRLDRFLLQYPETDVRIEVSQRLIDFAREDVDIGIRFGNGSYPGLRADRLFDDTIFPVCSPKLLKGARPLRHPRDLRHHTLIHVDWNAQGETWPDWNMWLLAAGVAKEAGGARGIHFTQTDLAIQAAIDGQGIALGDSTLAADDLASGRLIRPFDLSLKGPPQFAYYLVCPEGTADQTLVKAFREWIIAEAAQMKKPDGARRARKRSG
jgi:LysR family transcriptional regulator, glycine cleavage system transcriptional activator